MIRLPTQGEEQRGGAVRDGEFRWSKRKRGFFLSVSVIIIKAFTVKQLEEPFIKPNDQQAAAPPPPHPPHPALFEKSTVKMQKFK